MSSPIAKPKRNLFERALVKIHQRSSHSHRVDKLSTVLAEIINSQTHTDHPKLLDIGCGDMSMSRGLKSFHPGLSVVGIDVHPLPMELKDDDAWRQYKQFDGLAIPYDTGHFDIGILCDVLHHVNPAEQEALIREGLRACKFLLIKDHFEFGWLSRQALRGMDFLGNFGYGVSVPERYFTKQTLDKLVERAGGRFTVLKPEIDLYAHLPVVRSVTRKAWQFVGRIDQNLQ